jgi:hypothetical protein
MGEAVTVADLPKWPWLLVRGPRVSPEMAGEILVRTMWLPGLSGNSSKEVRLVKDAFGYSEPYRDALKESQKAGRPEWAAEYRTWERIENEVGSLGTQFIWNDRILSSTVSYNTGWVDWSGKVGTPGMSLLSKWPTLREITDDWQKIAAAFPGLRLDAQLIRIEWDEEGPAWSIRNATPLARWLVESGSATLQEDAGELIREPRNPPGTAGCRASSGPPYGHCAARSCAARRRRRRAHEQR